MASAPATADQAFTTMAQAGVPRTAAPRDEVIQQTPPSSLVEAQKEDQKEVLPKLSAQDFRLYNRMAEHMDVFHNHFRQTWHTLYRASTSRAFPPSAPSPTHLRTLGLQFCQHLTIHHTIEEQHIFPVLAGRMPVFAAREALLEQHARIHAGLDEFEDFLREGGGEKEWDWEGMRARMDGFGTVLWEHLDEEVKQLGAANMRRFWTKEEMMGMPM